MREMGWTYQQLMDTPFEKYLEVTRIMHLEEKEEAKESQRQQRKMESNV